MRSRLDKITQSLMIIQGTNDASIAVESASKIVNAVSSDQVEKIIVHAGHLITREQSRSIWFDKAFQFVEQVING